MDDLVKRLRDRDIAAWDDAYSCRARGTEAADAIEALQARVAELEAEAERRDEQIQDMIEASGQTCACGYDKASDVCLGHLSHFRKSVAAARNNALEDAARMVDCSCECRDAVLAAKTKVDRWNACGRDPCGALDAAAIRAMKGDDNG